MTSKKAKAQIIELELPDQPIQHTMNKSGFIRNTQRFKPNTKAAQRGLIGLSWAYSKMNIDELVDLIVKNIPELVDAQINQLTD